MSPDRGQSFERILHQRARAVADAWYQTIRASSSTPLTLAEVRQLVPELTGRITRLLNAPSCDRDAVDALAARLVSLRLPAESLGTLQEILVRQLVEGLSELEMASLRTQSGRLIGNLTAGLLRACQMVILEEQEDIRQAYLDAIQRAQREIRERDLRLQQQVDRLRALQQVDRGILAARSAREIAEAALRHLRQLIPCQRASVALFDLENHRARIRAAVPPEAFERFREQPSFPLTGWEEVVEDLHRDEIHVIDDVRRLPLRAPMREAVESRPPYVQAVVPLRAAGELLGSLNLALEDSEALTDQGASVAREVADSVAVAIQHTQLDASIAHHREQLRLLTSRLAELDEANRRALARDLHDRIGQKLTALGINLNVVKAGLDAEQVPRLCSRLDDSVKLLEETTDCVREVMAELRPPMLDDYGLVPTLRWCGEQLASRKGVDVSIEGHEPEPRLPPPIEDALVRITQEALTNVAKHAKASHVSVSLAQQQSTIRLTISDNGAGFDRADIDHSASPHWGLLTMTERAGAVGACCRIESQPGEGTRVLVEVPR